MNDNFGIYNHAKRRNCQVIEKKICIPSMWVVYVISTNPNKHLHFLRSGENDIQIDISTPYKVYWCEIRVSAPSEESNYNFSHAIFSRNIKDIWWSAIRGQLGTSY